MEKKSSSPPRASFYWNEKSQAPNTVSISTLIKYMGMLDGVKLHWVGGVYTYFFNAYGLDIDTPTSICGK